MCSILPILKYFAQSSGNGVLGIVGRTVCPEWFGTSLTSEKDGNGTPLLLEHIVVRNGVRADRTGRVEKV